MRETPFLCVFFAVCIASILACASGCTPTRNRQQGSDTQPPTTHSTTAAAEAGLPPDTKPQSIQPNYSQWLNVKQGMTETEVNKLLGPPLSEEDPNRAPSWATSYFATYGVIRFGRTHFDQPYTFSIIYEIQTKAVSQVDDPFGGHLSPDGKPTVPELITPKPGEQFSHYPRLVDYRWRPSSGEYPMRYEIQIRLDDFAHENWEHHTVARAQVNEPYFLNSFASSSRGRWRVRAINGKGTSDWSEERQFSFGHI